MQYLNNLLLTIVALLVSSIGCSVDETSARQTLDNQTLEIMQEMGKTIDTSLDSRIRFQAALDFCKLVREKMGKHDFTCEEITSALGMTDTDLLCGALRKEVDIDAFTPAELFFLFSESGKLKYVTVNVANHLKFPYTLEMAKKECKTTGLSESKLAELALRVAWLEEMEVKNCTLISLLTKLNDSMQMQFNDMGIKPYEIYFVDSRGHRIDLDDKRMVARFTLIFPFPSGSIKASLDVLSILTGCEQEITPKREIRLVLPDRLPFKTDGVNTVDHLDITI